MCCKDKQGKRSQSYPKPLESKPISSSPPFFLKINKQIRRFYKLNEKEEYSTPTFFTQNIQRLIRAWGGA